MQTTYVTRADEGIGDGAFDSIRWIFETHIKEPDTREFNFAVLRGFNEDSPDKIELWRSEPNYDTPADRVWKASMEHTNGEHCPDCFNAGYAARDQREGTLQDVAQAIRKLEGKPVDFGLAKLLSEVLTYIPAE